MDRELLAAVKDGDGKMCDALLKKGANVNAKSEYGVTPLMRSIVWKKECFERILEEKIYVETPLMYTGRCIRRSASHVYGKEKECFERILEEKKVDVNLADENGDTALHIAVKYGRDEKMCDTLLKKGANVNAKREYGRTPLMGSVSWNRRECFERILEEKKVDVNLANDKGKTALHFAVAYGRDEMCDALLKKGANVNAKRNNADTPLTDAVFYNSVKCVKIISEKAADLRGALGIAKRREFVEVIEILKWKQKMPLMKIREYTDGATLNKGRTRGKANIFSVKM